MRKIWETGWMGRLILLIILIAFLGLSPRQHQVSLDMDKARRAIEAGSFSEAARRLASAAEHQPGRNDLWESAGRYAMEAGNPQAAIQYLLRAAPGALSSQGWTDLGDAYLQSNDLPAAIRAWDTAVQNFGVSIPLCQRLHQAHRALQDYPASITDLQILVELQPTDAKIKYELGLLVATQQPETAIAYLVQAAELDPGLTSTVETLRQKISGARAYGDPAYALLTTGRALASLDRWDLATEAFRQATLARPDYAEAWAFLGEARQHLLDTNPSQTDGLADIQKALFIDPKSVAAQTFLALYWERHEKYDEALAALKTAVQLDPLNPILLVELGSVQATLGDLQAAMVAYQKAVSLAPQDVTYLQFLAGFSLKYEYELRQVALPVARQAILLAPQDPAVLDVMGQVLIKLNDLTNAERFLRRSLQADPNYAPAHLHLGLVFLLNGDETRSYLEFNLARKLAPGSPTADQSNRLLQTYFP